MINISNKANPIYFRADLSRISYNGIPPELIGRAHFGSEYDQMLKSVESGLNVEFNAPCGNGKSAMAQRLKFDLESSGKKATVISGRDLFGADSSALIRKDKFKELLTEMRKNPPDVLILDDLRAHYGITKWRNRFYKKELFKFIGCNPEMQVVVFDFDLRFNTACQDLFAGARFKDKLFKRTSGERVLIQQEKLSTDEYIKSGTALQLENAGIKTEPDLLAELFMEFKKRNNRFVEHFDIREFLDCILDMVRAMNQGSVMPDVIELKPDKCLEYLDKVI